MGDTGFAFFDDWDSIIIGGGIVGCFAALRLARARQRVLIVEGDFVGSAQSGRNLGFIRKQGRDLRELDLAREAGEAWQALAEQSGSDFGFRRDGNMALADDDDLAGRFEIWAREAQARGLDTRVLTPAEAVELVPGLKIGFKSALYTASDAKADPFPATCAAYEAARAAGAQIITGRRVDEILTEGGRATGVRIGNRRLRAKAVICTAGAGTGRLLRRLGITFPQDVIRATVVRTAAPDGTDFPALAPELSRPGIWGLNIGVRQSVDGSLHMSNAGGVYVPGLRSLGSLRWFLPLFLEKRHQLSIDWLGPLAFWRRFGDQAGYPSAAPHRDHPDPSPRFMREAFDELAQMFPDYAAKARILNLWSGDIENTPDLLPAVGPVAKVGNLLVGSGFSGHGFGVGPAAGEALAEIALGDQARDSLSELSPDRFANGTWSRGEFAL
ncbi:MAG: NAD(P)/FAD-dependent oxidoreductase [Tropicimonas sp.]|uniref:NAD(P)/FAD-dependent oxidoreductase n=1 Tax=Tropicimonas sp. TaxID=2067044 RepID=UPI003A8388E3